MKITQELVRFGLKPGNVHKVPLTIWSDRPDVLGVSPRLRR